MKDYDAVIIQVGGKTSPDDAPVQSAAAIVKLRETMPNAKVMLWVDGYDDDPRELWDVPEARSQVMDVFNLVFRARPAWQIEDLGLDEHSIALLGMCSGTMEITGRNPQNGHYIMQPKRRPG